jgi:hypothetical protein
MTLPEVPVDDEVMVLPSERAAGLAAQDVLSYMVQYTAILLLSLSYIP